MWLYQVLSLLVLILGCCGQYICPPQSLLLPCTCADDFYVRCKVQNKDVLVEVFKRCKGYAVGTLNVRSSTISHIPASVLEGTKIKELVVEYNTMESIFDRAPSEDNTLEKLIVEKNKVLRGINWEFFAPLNKLQSIYINDVPIKKLDKSFSRHISKRITVFTLYRCPTEKLDHEVFAQLTELYRLFVEETHIKVLKRSMFPANAKLMYISFKSNKIEFLPDGLFSNMPGLKFLTITDNLVATVSHAVFGGSISQLIELDLKDNPLNCNCDMKWMVPYFKDSSRKLEGKCKDPQEFLGRQLQDLTEQDFLNCA